MDPVPPDAAPLQLGATSPVDTGAEIVSTLELGVPPAPGGGPTVMSSGPPAQYDLRARWGREYVAGGYFAPLGDYVRTLPKWIDPVQRDFGIDIYDRMAIDPQVASCTELYKAAVLADGWRIVPAKDEYEEGAEGDEGTEAKAVSSKRAREAARYCEYVLNSLGIGAEVNAAGAVPFDLTLRQMLDGIRAGNKIAEIVCQVETDGPWAGDLTISRIKPKPATCTAFVMDAYDNFIGLLGIMPNVPFYGMWPAFGFLAGDGLTLLPGSGRDALQRDAPSLLPPEKFLIFTFDGQDGNPQGRSLYQRVFTPWWWKQNAYAIWGKFISKHADPSLVGTTAEGAIGEKPMLDMNGNPIIDQVTGKPFMLSPVDELGQQLAVFENGSYIALPYGADVKALNVANDGEAIAKFMEEMDRQIAKGILGTTLATEESKHSSRAQSGTHEHGKDDVTRYGQIVLQAAVRSMLAVLCREKYGPGYKSIVPHFLLGQEEQTEFKDFCAGVSALQTSGYLHYSQLPALDEKGGLPPRDLAKWMADVNEAKEQAQAAADAATQGRARKGYRQ